MESQLHALEKLYFEQCDKVALLLRENQQLTEERDRLKEGLENLRKDLVSFDLVNGVKNCREKVENMLKAVR